MFLKKNKKNLRSLLSVFAVLGLAITALWWGANTSTINAQVVRGTLFDFSGEGRTDFTTLSGSPSGNITWNIVVNPVIAAPNQGIIRRFDFGFLANTAQGRLQDVIVPADYVGDRKTEIAVYRRSNSVYYLAQFPAATNTGIMLDRAVPFGIGATDIALEGGDYDGDGKDDYTVVRNVGGTVNWLIMSSGTNTFKSIPFGRTGITGTTGTFYMRGADFTGDGRDELVFVNRNTAGTVVNYYIGDSNTGAGVITKSFGNFNTDFSFPPADYTGDGRADFVAVRETDGAAAIWYINNSVTNVTTATRFGIADPNFTDLDVPVRGDYDGDRRHDIAVYRESNRTFYYISTANNGSFQGQEAGPSGETPLASFGLY
ncbi:hypothetical protein BH24ACI1_BH24ACI1_11840 [soil metagenome]